MALNFQKNKRKCLKNIQKSAVFFRIFKKKYRKVTDYSGTSARSLRCTIGENNILPIISY